MVKTSTLLLTELLVNTENYRFDSVGSQKEAIDEMISDQEEKLYNLALHIVKNGLNPNDRVQVTKSGHDRTKYNVLEGNRRVVALKLLSNPDLIDQSKYSSLKKKFKALHDEKKNSIVTEIECTVYDDSAEADKWIQLKHTGENDGIGTVSWNSQQIGRFTEKVEGKSPLALQAIRILQNSSDVPNDVKKNLNQLKTSNFDRLLADPKVRDFLGIAIDKGVIRSDIEEKEVVKGLAHIAKDLLSPEFKVKDIYTKEDREAYIEAIPQKDKPDVKNKSQTPWQYNHANLTGATTAKTKRSIPVQRRYLIPKSCILKIHNQKTNSIYDELRRLNVENYTNAVAVLFRVFVELSADVFIQKNKLPNITKDSKLVTKILGIANHMEKQGLADKHVCKGIRTAVSNPNNLLGIDTLHAYVHNNMFSPSPKDLFTTWNNIQVFVEKLWENAK